MITPHWIGSRWRIQTRKDGKRYSFSCNIPGAKGRKECIKKYEQWYYGEASGEKTVSQVCKEFLNDVKARKGDKAPAVELYDRHIRLYIASQCGQKKMCKMTLKDWQSVLNNAQGQNKALSEKTLKTLRGVIMSIIKFGYEDYQCEMPRGKLYIPYGHWSKEKEILQREDVRRLLEPSDLFYWPVFAFGVLTGMRPGEILGIKTTDISEDFTRLYIKRSVSARNQITEGKNANAKRMIPICNLASQILKDTIKRNEILNLHTEWVFCSCDGSMGNQSTMRHQWARLKQERGLPGTVYSLRHTFISLMKNVMPEQMIKDIVGHSVSMSTFETYGHIYDNETKEAAKIIDLTLGDNLGDKKSANDGL